MRKSYGEGGDPHGWVGSKAPEMGSVGGAGRRCGWLARSDLVAGDVCTVTPQRMTVCGEDLFY